ncbi:hypothetical protein ACFQMJ_19365 [Cohnella cellulosilytica]|uniref:Uncharacterized protein n=1 Tax=Cohnella cellulosilytica TaxID=986710 RepID=A0ABW2FBP3_9BACL
MKGEFPGETLGHAGSSARGAAGKDTVEKRRRRPPGTRLRFFALYDPANRGKAQAAFKRDLQFYEKYGLLKDEKFNVKVYTGSHTERMEVA